MRPWAYDSEKNVHKRESSSKKIIHEILFFWQRDSSMRLNADWMKPNDSERRKEYEEKSISAHNIPQTSIFPVYKFFSFHVLNLKQYFHEKKNIFSKEEWGWELRM